MQLDQQRVKYVKIMLQELPQDFTNRYLFWELQNCSVRIFLRTSLSFLLDLLYLFLHLKDLKCGVEESIVNAPLVSLQCTNNAKVRLGLNG
jgi:hypothetical protein